MLTHRSFVTTAATLLISGFAHSSVILDLTTGGPLGDIGIAGTATSLDTFTQTIYADATLSTLSITNTGQPISFDLTIATNPTAFFTQSGTGLGTATGITGTNNNILLPLTLTLDSINTGGLFASINITEALFGGVFNVDSLTANEITIDTGLGTGNVTGDFADTTTLWACCIIPSMPEDFRIKVER